MKTDNLALLTIEATKKLLEGSIELFKVLRCQLSTSILGDIEFDGYGFYAHFVVNEQYKILNDVFQFLDISDLVGFNQSNECVVGFVLFINEGKIATLEGFSILTDDWPLEDIHFMYTEPPSERNTRYVEKRSSSFYEKYNRFGPVHTKGCGGPLRTGRSG